MILSHDEFLNSPVDSRPFATCDLQLVSSASGTASHRSLPSRLLHRFYPHPSPQSTRSSSLKGQVEECDMTITSGISSTNGLPRPGSIAKADKPQKAFLGSCLFGPVQPWQTIAAGNAAVPPSESLGSYLKKDVMPVMYCCRCCCLLNYQIWR